MTNVVALVAAIWLAEGGTNTKHQYGIMTKTKDPRSVCVTTILNNWERWNGQGCFVEFLGDIYCPKSVDPVGNRNWKKNVKALVGHRACDCSKRVPRLVRPVSFPPKSEYRRFLQSVRREKALREQQGKPRVTSKVGIGPTALLIQSFFGALWPTQARMWFGRSDPHVQTLA